METIKLDDSTDSRALSRRVADVILDGGLVCLPCGGTYRLATDLTNTEAVFNMMQSKRRARTAPALIFIDHEDRLAEVAADLHPLARRLASQLWPQPLTVRVQLHPDLPRKIAKQLGGKKAKVGVRIPADPLARDVASKVGRPLLVSSANRERKHGESSPAQIRRTFGARVDLFVDRGDLPPAPASTVIAIVDDALSIERAGAIEAETLHKLVANGA